MTERNIKQNIFLLLLPILFGCVWGGSGFLLGISAGLGIDSIREKHSPEIFFFSRPNSFLHKMGSRLGGLGIGLSFLISPSASGFGRGLTIAGVTEELQIGQPSPISYRLRMFTVISSLLPFIYLAGAYAAMRYLAISFWNAKDIQIDLLGGMLSHVIESFSADTHPKELPLAIGGMDGESVFAHSRNFYLALHLFVLIVWWVEITLHADIYHRRYCRYFSYLWKNSKFLFWAKSIGLPLLITLLFVLLAIPPLMGDSRPLALMVLDNDMSSVGRKFLNVGMIWFIHVYASLILAAAISELGYLVQLGIRKHWREKHAV